MEMIIPVELQIAIWVIISGAIAYLFIQMSDNKNKLNLLDQDQRHLSQDLKEALKDLKDDVDSLSKRFDLFIADERAFFKRLHDTDKKVQ